MPGDNEGSGRRSTHQIKTELDAGRKGEKRDVSVEVAERIPEDIHEDKERTAWSDSLIQVQLPCGC